MLNASFRSVLRSLASALRSRQPSNRSGRKCRPVVEHLEDRTVPSTFVVNSTADTWDATPLDGQALDGNGQTSLRAAVMQANYSAGSDTIQLPAGTFRFTIAGQDEYARYGDLDLTDTSGTLTIVGAGAGQTIIDAARLDRIFDVKLNTTVILEGMTLTNGSVSNTSGGGILNRGNLTITDCELTQNVAGSYGGAIDTGYATSAALTVSGCTFTNNKAGQTAGPPYNSGGAIHNMTGPVSIASSRFNGNSATGQGGAIDSTTGPVTVQSSTFDSNSATSGGAVHLYGGTDNIIESTLTNNQAQTLGGALLVQGAAQLSVTRSTFASNRVTAASGLGGAIDNATTTSTQLQNVTVSGNSAGTGAASDTAQGGGIYSSGALGLYNCTVSSNQAHDGGGVWYNGQSFYYYFVNDIIALNIAVSGPDYEGTMLSLGGNLIGNGSGASITPVGYLQSRNQVGTATAPIDPLLGPLQDNGGPTFTQALLPGSPAFDRGVPNDSEVVNGQVPSTDQRNLPRFGLDQGAAVDIGAYEDQAPEAVSDTYSTAEDTKLTVSAATGVLANDTDVDHDPLSAVLVSGPTHGLLHLNADGSFDYTPDANYNGDDTFMYQASDGNLASKVVSVTITVTPVNDPPVATDDNYALDENSSLTIVAPGVLANDTDVDSATLSAIVITLPTHGKLSFQSDGSFVYTPTAYFFGTDSFTYRPSDGQATGNLATVTITVRQVVQHVAIDIKPGDDTNTINLTHKKTIAVAILSTATFNAPASVDIGSLTFGATGDEQSLVRNPHGKPRYEIADVNGDGLLDLVVYFDTTTTGLTTGDTEAVLKGTLLDGTPLYGTDAVTVTMGKRP